MTLRSVRNQSYRNIEHIVIDGASTDGTTDLLRRYEPTYQLRWSSQPDSGMYQAINLGLSRARGDIIAYLNSDDLYLPWAIEAVVEHFAGRPDADFVFGGAVDINEHSSRQSLNFQLPFDADYLRRRGFLCQPAVFWRRRVLEEEGPFDETLNYVADCDYWMRLADRRRFAKLNEFVAVQRNHDATLRESQSQALNDEIAGVRRRYVTMHGWHHQRALIGHRIREGWWWRAYWVMFSLQNLLPKRLRGRAWSRLIGSGRFEIRWWLLPLKLIPGLADRRPRVIRPSRYWLEPPAGKPRGTVL
jgi:glycosyltransferase involved in cell wall biosynthesis